MTLRSPTPLAAPTGGLFGGMTLINVLAGEDYTEDAIALADFRTQGVYNLPGDIKPDLRDVTTAAVTIDNTAGTSIVTSPLAGFLQPIDAVSAVLMHDHVYNEFVLDPGTLSGTDWIVTMPTKRYYYSDGTSATPGTVLYLFQRNFIETGACDDIALALIDREEFRTIPGFSPPPKPGGKASLCWEANVMVFPSKFPGSNGIFGSNNTLNVTTSFAMVGAIWVSRRRPAKAPSVTPGARAVRTGHVQDHGRRSCDPGHRNVHRSAGDRLCGGELYQWFPDRSDTVSLSSRVTAAISSTRRSVRSTLRSAIIG